MRLRFAASLRLSRRERQLIEGPSGVSTGACEERVWLRLPLSSPSIPRTGLRSRTPRHESNVGVVRTGVAPCPASGYRRLTEPADVKGSTAMWKEIRKAAIVLATSLIAATLLALPAAGKSRLPPEDDGSSYTWPSATTVTVDVEPWGGGYVRSTPYLIDCPLACIRPFDAGRKVTFTAYRPGGSPSSRGPTPARARRIPAR